MLWKLVVYSSTRTRVSVILVAMMLVLLCHAFQAVYLTPWQKMILATCVSVFACAIYICSPTEQQTNYTAVPTDYCQMYRP